MKYHLITVAILLAAFTLYGFGLSGFGDIAFIAGGACELWFWVRLFYRRTRVKRNQ
jgi:hypothetical protein